MTNLKDFSTNGSPNFCIIAPIAYLEQYSTLSHTHLVLAHLVDTNDEYASFYKRMSDRGDRIICDNGAFELGESYSPEKLIEIGTKCGADALVLPDYPFKHAQITIEAAQKWIPLFRDAGFKCAFVPQSEKGGLDQWIDAYQWAATNPEISIICMSILGIPNALPHIPVQYARVVMSQILKDRNIVANKFHHYLGLQSGANVEIPSLIKLGILNSCDSSNPVWCGINGLKYNTTMTDFMPMQKKYLREVDFYQDITKKSHIHEIIKYNVDLTLEIFADPASYL